MADNNEIKEKEKRPQIKATLDALLDGMDGFVSSKNVVGEPITVGDTIIIPLIDVSFAVGAGAGSGTGENKGCGGVGGKMTPNSVLVIQGGHTRLISVKKQDAFTKIVDMVPDLVQRFTQRADGGKDLEDDEALNAAFPENE